MPIFLDPSLRLMSAIPSRANNAAKIRPSSMVLSKDITKSDASNPIKTSTFPILTNKLNSPTPRRSFQLLPDVFNKLSKPVPTEIFVPIPLPPQEPAPVITPQQFTHGSYRTSLTAARYGLNIIEWLHLILGHLSEKYIRWIVASKAVKGLKVTSKELANVHMRLCYACLISNMKAFPVYESLNDVTRMPLRKITSDYKTINGPEIYGRTCYFLFADVDITKWWFYPANSMSEWFPCFQHLLETEEKKTGYKLQSFQTDFNKMPVAGPFAAYLRDHDVEYQLSAPYKKEQSLSETQINIVDNGIRSQLTYNQAESKWWAFAGECLEHVHNELPAYKHTRSRNDEMYSRNTVHSDVSSFDPFFSKGVAHITPDERATIPSTKVLTDHGLLVRFLGYASHFQIRRVGVPNADVHLKDSFIIYRNDNQQIQVRHDCVFPGTTDLDIASFDITGIDSFDNFSSKARINHDLGNKKSLLESYDRAFGKWKSHHWTPLLKTSDPNDEPLYTIVPQFDNFDTDPNNPDEPIHVRVELDEFGFVKPSKPKRSKKSQPPPHISTRPQRSRTLTSAMESYQKSSKHSPLSALPHPINHIPPTIAAKIISSFIPISTSQPNNSLPDFILVKHSLNQRKDEIFDIISCKLAIAYQKKCIHESHEERSNTVSNLLAFTNRQNTFKQQLDASKNSTVQAHRRHRMLTPSKC